MSSHNKKIVIPIIILLVLAVAAIATIIILKNRPKAEENPNSTPQTTQTTEDPAKVTDCADTPEATDCKTESTEKKAEEEVATPVEENTKAQTQNEGSDPNKSAALTGVFTHIAATDEKLTIRVNIDQYLSSGTCELTLKNGDKSYTESANIADSASTSTCEGFDIPLSKLSSGSWGIIIRLSSGDKTGEISGKVAI